MAVDSRQKRTSMISSGRRLPWFRRFTLPVPDSSVETPDRAQLASIYSGLIASSLPSPSSGGGGGMLMMGVGGGGGPSLPQITELLFHEDFSVDKAATFAGAVAEDTSTGIGQRVWWNAGTNDNISNGVLNYASNTNLILSDNADNRARLDGRCHYIRMLMGSSGDISSFYFGLYQKTNTNGYAWFLGSNPMSAMYLHESSGSLRDLRKEFSPSPGSNYQVRSVVAFNDLVEFVMLERNTAGLAFFYRIGGTGQYRLFYMEDQSSLAGRASAWNSSSTTSTPANRLQQFTTANTDFSFTPLVQHSFASVTGPSDGAGSPETGGNGVSAITVGDVTITGSKLAMSSDTEGIVVFDSGEKDICMSVRETVYDGSPCGVVLRYVDENNYLKCEVDSTNDTLILSEIVAGSETALVTKNLNPGTTDTTDITDGYNATFIVRDNADDKIEITLFPGSLHDAFIEHTTTRFNTATKQGVIISKGTSVNSATAEDLVIFAGLMTLPAFENA